MPKIKSIQVSDVFKKDLKLIGYLFVFGLVTYVSEKYLKTGDLSIVFGAVANYLLVRLEKELKDEGYMKAMK